MSNQLTKANEIESVTTLAAKAFARVLEAEKKAYKSGQISRSLNGTANYASLKDAMNASPEDLSWHAMGRLEDARPGSFATLWERVKQYAKEELESGARAATVAVSDQRPLTTARFLVLREKYIEEWQPRNVLESQLIDAVCQAQTLREYWMKMAIERAAVECQIERVSIEERGKWRDIEIDGSQAARDAREEADRWDRVFIRSVRALRDLRRYSTAVIVNNQGGQVNLASEGGQQTNVVKEVKKKKVKANSEIAVGRRKLKAVN